MKSTIRASVALFAGVLLILTMIGCPNPTLLMSKSKSSGSITGIVVSDTGATIAGVAVTAELTDGIQSLSTQRKLEGTPGVKSIAAQTTTDLNGSFTLSGLAPGIYTLNASVPDTQAKAVAGVTVLEGQTVTTGTLQVRKTGDIAGLVALSDNADPLGIVVFIAGTSFSAMTDAEGYFRMLDIPVGTAYTLVASKTGYDSCITTVDVAVRSTTTISPMTLNIHVSPATTGSVTGVVSLGDSADRAGIFVFLDGTSLICMTDTLGEFTLRGVPVGTWNVKAAKEGYVTASIPVTVVAGSSASAGTMTLEPRPATGIGGPYFVVYDANGATVGTAPVDTLNYLAGFKVTVLGGGILRKSLFEPFTGWNTKADGSGTQYQPSDTFTMGSTNVTLYATFLFVPRYSLTYDGNGATGGSVPVDPSSPYFPNEYAELRFDCTLVKEGYYFEGWSTDPTLEHAPYPADGTNQQIQIYGSNVVLYAIWAPANVVGTTGPAGGIIFFDKGYYSNHWQYMEVALVDCNDGHIWAPEESRFWEFPYFYLTDGFGQGWENTLTIVYQVWDSAAEECMLFTQGGFQDWFLPSLDELKVMRNVLEPLGIGNFMPGSYWSSSYSESDFDTPPSLDMISGMESCTAASSLLRVRAARRY